MALNQKCENTETRKSDINYVNSYRDTQGEENPRIISFEGFFSLTIQPVWNIFPENHYKVKQQILFF